VTYNSAVSIKDGETKQLISAPDKATGEVMKIDVTLTLESPRRASLDLRNDMTAREAFEYAIASYAKLARN
jgi:hypothetical protein